MQCDFLFTYSYAVMANVWLLGSLVSALASMLCKEQGITVVAVCVVYDLLQNFQACLHATYKHHSAQHILYISVLSGYYYMLSIYIPSQVNKQPLVKILDTLLTDLEKIPAWLIQSLKRTFIMTAFAIIAVSWRVHLSQGGPHKDIFHK